MRTCVLFCIVTTVWRLPRVSDWTGAQPYHHANLRVGGIDQHAARREFHTDGGRIARKMSGKRAQQQPSAHYLSHLAGADPPKQLHAKCAACGTMSWIMEPSASAQYMCLQPSTFKHLCRGHTGHSQTRNRVLYILERGGTLVCLALAAQSDGRGYSVR